MTSRAATPKKQTKTKRKGKQAMKKFNPPPPELLKALEPYHKQFQGIIAFTANKALGATTTPIRAIGKHEGGVTVNNCEICIKHDYCFDDFRPGATNSGNPPSPEEEATAKAIESVLSKLTPDNIVPGLMQAQQDAGLTNEDLNMFIQNPYMADPLREFFRK
jgi:hypothetical protein